MFGGWFNDRPDGDGLQPGNTQSEGIGSASASSRSPSQQTTSRSPLPSTTNAPDAPAGTDPPPPSLTSAHDEVVQDMDARLHALMLAAQPPASSLPEGSGSGQHIVEEEMRTRPPENLFDPFTAQSIGLLAPGTFPAREDDLWAHLKDIRDLQAEIATMHAHMEGLGTVAAERRPRRRETTGDDDAINVEEAAKAAKAEEFARLSDRFAGRKEAIDNIMSKVSLTPTLRE